MRAAMVNVSGSFVLALSLMLGGLAEGAAEEQTPPPPPTEGALEFAEAAVPVKGSEADKDLQARVAARLFDMDQASRPTCKPKLLPVKTLEPKRRGAWIERWFVRGCEQVLPYRVAFEPDDAGTGTTFTAMADVGAHGTPTH
ncbi:MAG: hypothetical protein HYT90_05875 [Candidatus Omnitrophica bacterium]|nr:hypothetical protein [Candidatus Omnitrophota bacterium]